MSLEAITPLPNKIDTCNQGMYIVGDVSSTILEMQIAIWKKANILWQYSYK